MLSLLRQRIPHGDTADLISRRHPHLEPPLELVPLALGLLAERETARLVARIPEMTARCRTLLRLRLQGHSFAQISEEMNTDAVEVWVRCRPRLIASKPLPRYAAGLLSAEQRLALFAEALRDPGVFRSLRDEHTLITLLDDPAARAQLLAATEEARFTIRGGLREWYERPRSKVMVLLGLVAWLVILVRECGRG